MSAITLPPYAALLGVTVADAAVDERSGPTLSMPFDNRVEGRPGALHGGATAGLIELAANTAIAAAATHADEPFHVKPIGVTIDYLRPGLSAVTFARGRVTRVGRRVATVFVEAWQDDADAPIALARVHMLVVRDAA